MRKHRRLFIAVISLVSVSLLAEAAARLLPGWAQWYSARIYPLWVGTLGRFSGLFPLSLSELGLYLLPLLLIFSFIRAVYKKSLRRWGCRWLCFLLGLGMLFIFNCGINYYRESFETLSGIRRSPHTVSALEKLCARLTSEVNSRAELVRRGEDGGMALSAAAPEQARDAMRALGAEYAPLDGYYPRPKGLLYASLLSWQQLSGVYSPFTIEANYNDDMPAYNQPFTMCHELSHLRGFMQEQEANFIAFLACSRSEELSFQYSAYLTAWVYSFNALYAQDREAALKFSEVLAAPARIDLTLNTVFWQRYEGRVAELSEQVNNSYLKANGQKDGVQSYGQLVDLLLSYYDSEQAGEQAVGEQ